MNNEATIVKETAAPADGPIAPLDVSDLGPPAPLQRTLELIASLPADAVVVQRNDRAPQFLYAKLGDRGYQYETLTRDGAVWTVIWQSETE